MKKIFAFLAACLLSITSLYAATSIYRVYEDEAKTKLWYTWSIDDQGNMYVTTDGKRLPDFSVNNPAPWTSWQAIRENYTDPKLIKYIKHIYTDAEVIPMRCFADLPYVHSFHADKAVHVGSAAFCGMGMPGFTLVLPNVESMDDFAFFRCNAGVIALPKVRIVKSAFFQCPYLKQVDLGRYLTEIQRNSFMYCPMMWLDDEPNIFLSCTKAPKMNRGYWKPGKNDIGAEMAYYSKLGGYKEPDELVYADVFYNSTCFDNEDLMDVVLRPYQRGWFLGDKASIFEPQPDDEHFVGKPVMVMPIEAADAENIDGWMAFAKAWDGDVNALFGGRVYTKSDYPNYTGYWTRNTAGFTPTAMTINTYEWELDDYLTENDLIILRESDSKTIAEDLKRYYFMPWYNDGVYVSSFVNDLYIKTPVIKPFMFGPKLYASKVTFDGVKKVGEYAFYQSEITNPIENLSKVTEIGAHAFEKNTSEHDLQLPELEKLGKYAFADATGLENIILSDQLYFTEIPEGAFSGCTKLTTAHIGKRVGTLGKKAFANTGLDNDNPEQGLYMYSSAPSYEASSTFSGLNLSKIYLHIPEEDYSTYDKDGSEWKRMKRNSGINFPITGTGWEIDKEGILHVTQDLGDFDSGNDQPWKKYRHYIKQIIVHSPVKEIGNYWFYMSKDQSNLTRAYIPFSVKRIGAHAFENNTKLGAVWQIRDYTTMMPDINAYDKEHNKYLYRTQQLYLSSVEKIDASAFSNCELITHVAFGDKIQEMGSYVFYNVPLWHVYVYTKTPPTITNYTFDKVTSDKIVCDVRHSDFDVQLNYITDLKWRDLTYLFDEGEIWFSAQYNKGKYFLTSKHILHIVPADESGVVGCTGYLDWTSEKVSSAYSSTDFSAGNKVADQAHEVVVHDGVTYLGSVCCNLKNVTKVTLPSSVKELYNTFCGCTSLSSISLPNVKYLKAYPTSNGGSQVCGAFGNCTNLESIHMPKVTYIGQRTFENCEKLSKGCFTSKIDTIEGAAYYNCKSLKEADLQNVKKLESNMGGAFEGCSSLEWINLGNLNPPYDGFKNCIALEKIVLGNQISSFGHNAFYGCSEVKEIHIVTPTPPAFDLWPGDNETVQDDMFGGQSLASIKVYTMHDFKSHYEEAEGWSGMTIVTDPESEEAPAIPAAGYLIDGKGIISKWEITTDETMSIFTEDPNGKVADVAIDPRVKYYCDYVSRLRIAHGITEMSQPVFETLTGHGCFKKCTKVFIPSTMKKMAGSNLFGSPFFNNVQDVYCFAEKPVDINYQKIVGESLVNILTAYTSIFYLKDATEDDIKEAHQSLSIKRLHVLKKEGVKEAYEAAAGYKDAFLEIIADLTEGQEEVEPVLHNVVFYDINKNVITSKTVIDGGSLVDEAPEAPQEEGYEFTGWSESLENITSDLAAYAQYAPLEIYAVFSTNGKNFTLYYDAKREERGGIDNWWADKYREAREAVIDVTLDVTMQDARPTSLGMMFRHFKQIAQIYHLDYLNTSEATEMNGMFNGCEQLKTLDLSSFNTEKVTDMSFMFNDCYELKRVDLSGFNTSNVTNMCYMFADCQSITSLDVRSFDVSKVTNMNDMFVNCQRLVAIYCEDDWSENAPNIEISQGMFADCYSLPHYDRNINDQDIRYAHPYEEENLGYFCTTTPKILYGAYDYYTNELTIFYDEHKDENAYSYTPEEWYGSEWITYVNKVTFDESIRGIEIYRTDDWFNGFTNLTEFENLDYLSWSRISNAARMFKECRNLVSFSFPKPEDEDFKFAPSDATAMFFGCENLETLDLTGMTMVDCNNMSAMFATCYKLKTIECNEDWSQYAAEKEDLKSDLIFAYCVALEGGNGTKCADTQKGIEYARPDIEGQPGYFTKKSGTGLEVVQDNNRQDNASCSKLLRDGQLLIIRDGKTYNSLGTQLR